jgi:hypothetical protein
VKLATVAESREAERLGGEWNTRLRDEAALLISCIDCNALLATVTWVQGRPLAAAQAQGDRLAPERRIRRHWACSWADRGTVLHARVGAHRHVIDLDDVQGHLPAAGRPRAKMLVRHTGPGNIARPV